MISRTARSMDRINRATDALTGKVTAGPSGWLSHQALRAVNEYVAATEEFQVDIPGSESYVVVGLSAVRIRLSVERDGFSASEGTSINEIAPSDLLFTAWLRVQLEAWRDGKTTLFDVLTRSTQWKGGAL